MPGKHPLSPERFSRLIELERTVRQAQSRTALGFTIVNETRRLVPYHQGVLLLTQGRRPTVAAISDIPAVDRHAPFVQWLERATLDIGKGPRAEALHEVESDELAPADNAQWREYGPPHLVWVPLETAQRGRFGALVIGMDRPVQDHESTLLAHLSGTFAHALQAFTPSRPASALFRGRSRTLWAGLIGAIFAATFMIRVPLTAMAPAEMVPLQPYRVTAPFEGVVRKIHVQTNQAVNAGVLLAVMDDTELQNRYEVAGKALAVTEEEYARARRGAFASAESQAMMAELRVRVELRRTELAYTLRRLKKSRLTADRSGVAITGPAEEWEGRPVAVGEAIMQIADPQQVAARIMLPVKDAVLLTVGGRVRIFLDSDPMAPLWGRVACSEYLPEVTARGEVAYRVTAMLASGGRVPRIGLRGTAKVYGPKASLAYFVFRRPVTWLRQATGI